MSSVGSEVCPIITHLIVKTNISFEGVQLHRRQGILHPHQSERTEAQSSGNNTIKLSYEISLYSLQQPSASL